MSAATLILSPTARSLEAIIRCARVRKGGVRQVGRKYLARRLGRSERTVSRYIRELREAGRLEVTKPRVCRTSRGTGWATIETNRYRLTCPSHPAPHTQKPRSVRGDINVPSPLRGVDQRPVRAALDLLLCPTANGSVLKRVTNVPSDVFVSASAAESASGSPCSEFLTVARYYAVPLELSEANALVSQWHRHHQPCQGHRFSLGAVDAAGILHGAAIVGRPVARLAGSPRDVLEVVRLVTDGTENCCSLLYAAAARAGAAMGYRRIQTYVLASETGTSLRAAGWQDEGTAGGGQWKHTDGKPRRTDQPIDLKRRWSKDLAHRPDLAAIPDRATKSGAADPDLFGGVA